MSPALISPPRTLLLRRLRAAPSAAWAWAPEAVPLLVPLPLTCCSCSAAELRAGKGSESTMPVDLREELLVVRLDAIQSRLNV